MNVVPVAEGSTLQAWKARRANPVGTYSLSSYRILPLASSSASARTRTSPVVGQEKTIGPGAILPSLTRSSSYFFAVVPGCLGAGRKDRLPNYFFRSIVLVSIMLVPLAVLNAFAGAFYAAVGVAQLRDAHHAVPVLVNTIVF